jgi:hypothetical protein
MMASGRPGSAESLLEGAGFEVSQRGTVDVTREWPDVDPLSGPARRSGFRACAAGDARFTEILTEALAPGSCDGCRRAPDVGIHVAHRTQARLTT